MDGLAARSGGETGGCVTRVGGAVSVCLTKAVGPIVFGNTSMLKTPGFEDQFIVGGGLYGGNVTYSVRYQSQWLYYRLWASYYDSRGQVQWVKGKAIARQGELGDLTSGIDTYFEIEPGKWVTTGWIGSGAPNDVSVLVLPYRNVNYRITAEYTWGPVLDWNGRLAYAGTTHYEDKGVVRC